MSAERRPPSLAGADWLTRREIRAVFAAIGGGGYETRAVGGAVRNALMARAVKDVDLATPAWPAEVARLAAAAGLKAVPTGVEHGTVTVVSGGVPYEVTTLREDVETFGRRARVTFTADWTKDARRRDFTMNALYCGADGAVFDPLNGYPDLAARRVRFIGDARARIREDYLRILRFFRLYAEYGQGGLDARGAAACAAERDGLRLISAERIRAELLRLLAAPRAVEAVAALVESGVLEIVLGESGAVPVFVRVAEIEQFLGRRPDPILRLAALVERSDATTLAERLRLSNAEAEKLSSASRRDPAFDPAAPEANAKALLYRIGPAAFTDGALGDWARSADPSNDARRRERSLLPERWTPPAMPFRGAHVLALGVSPGPRVKRILSDFEGWWIAEGFPSDLRTLEAKLAEIAAREAL